MKVLVINGPNLNVLGSRDHSQYGAKTLDAITKCILEKSEEIGVEIEFYQSNHEGAIIDYLQSSAHGAEGIIINGGALTHYGLSLRDALVDTRLPIIEVHLSNIYSREDFRNHSVIASIAIGQIVGLGWQGYILALEYLCTSLRDKR